MDRTTPHQPALIGSAPIAYEPPPLGAEREPPRPSGTPDDVVLRWTSPIPIPADRADLDVRPGELRDAPGEFAHRFVTVGDSLTQGFKSLAIAEPWLSWPMIVAHALGLRANYAPTDDIADPEFTFASFDQPSKAPGLPLNLEALLRAVDAAVGGRSLDFHGPAMAAAIGSAASTVADYWQHGEGAAPVPPRRSFHHNLSVWGFDLRDALDKSPDVCRAVMDAQHAHEHLLPSLLHRLEQHVRNEFLTSYPMQRTALRVLAGPEPNATQIDAAEWFGANGGIETLVVALGANNALGIVQSMQLRWTKDPEYQDVREKDAFDIWAPSHFEHEYSALLERIKRVRAKHVILATVPHVTIVPLLRGVGEKPYYSRYFARYTRPWISDAAFDASVHPCLTSDEARTVDAAIDQYNYVIKRAVRDAREQGCDFYLLDMCGLFDLLAYRRYLASPGAQPDWFEPYELPPALRALTPRPDTRFLGTDIKGRSAGGLIALDGVHPTTIGYGILAQEVVDIMHEIGRAHV